MTDIEQKALALVNEVARELGWGEIKEIFAAGYTRNEALFRAIEQHEAFRQEVSDAVEHFKRCYPSYQHASLFDRFIIPKPKPDPLMDVLDKMLRRRFLDPLPDVLTDEAHWLRAELEARGLEIREKGQ